MTSGKESTAHQSQLKDEVEGSKTQYQKATVPSFVPHSKTALTATEEKEADSLDKILTIPQPSIPRITYRGKTMGKWAIERRRIAKELFDKWEISLNSIQTPSFAIHVDTLVSEIDKKIHIFRNIPYEDTFSGILQLIRDAFTGENFSLLEEKRKDSVVNKIFELLIKTEKLDLSIYQESLKLMVESGLRPHHN
jgi:hypothetical protein